VTVESILTTSDQAYSKVNINSTTMEKEADDIEGPFSLGVSITETLDDDKETQIIYYSTGNLMDSQVNQVVSGGNEQVVMSTVNWLCSSEETTSVSIPVKSLEVSYLSMTAYDSSFWTICTIGLIPGFFLVAGFMIWFKRRKA
jgi:ABC-2 type transport system permease protein